MDNQIILQAKELWARFQTIAQFKDTAYDANFEKQIRAELNLPLTGSMTELLLKSSVSIERLLSAILIALQPFPQMMIDLLQMFEKVAANKCYNNRRIRFDFNVKGTSYSFNLKHFRESVWQTNEKLTSLYSLEDPWKMVYLFQKSPGYRLTYGDISKLGLCHDNSTDAACWGDPKPQISAVPVLTTHPSDA